MVKKVLIITYYWPPAGGISPLRCLKIAKYLRKFNWEPIIYTPSNADYPIIDNDYLIDVPEGITVLKQPIIEPFKLFKLLSGKKPNASLNNIFHVRDKKENVVDRLGKWIRSNFFIPDARALWIRPSVKYLSKYLKNNKIDAIFTDGPPHTNTVIALKLKQKFGIPWLADFQDPWTQVDYYQNLTLTKWANHKHHQLEQEVFKNANKTCIASPTWAEDLESIGTSKTETLFYGYDEDDFKNINLKLDDEFTIFHGGLLGYDRLPEGLFKAINELCSENSRFAEKVKLKFAGQVDFEVKKRLHFFNLESKSELLGIIPRKEVLHYTSTAQLILLPINKAANAKGRIPGKLFECLRARRPILCLGNHDADTAKIVLETQSGQVFNYEDVHKIKQFLLISFDAYLQQKLHVNSQNIEQYSNFNQTKKVANWLNEIVGN